MNQPFETFCDQVCISIRWPPAQRLAREELTAHLEDHAAALEAQGVPPEEAALHAVAAMGDPYELGRQLDKCHSPLFPGLTAFLALTGLVLIFFSCLLSFQRHTGLFAHDSLLPPAHTLPSLRNETLVVSGSVSGHGSIGGYRITAKNAALVYAPEYMGLPSHLELQIALSTSHWQLWLDDLDLYEVPCTWIDSTGATGTASCYSWENSPLTGTGYLKIQTPTPGAQWFTVTLGRPGDQIMLRIDLEEEVPAS